MEREDIKSESSSSSNGNKLFSFPSHHELTEQASETLAARRGCSFLGNGGEKIAQHKIESLLNEVAPSGSLEGWLAGWLVLFLSHLRRFFWTPLEGPAAFGGHKIGQKTNH